MFERWKIRFCTVFYVLHCQVRSACYTFRWLQSFAVFSTIYCAIPFYIRTIVAAAEEHPFHHRTVVHVSAWCFMFDQNKIASNVSCMHKMVLCFVHRAHFSFYLFNDSDCVCVSLRSLSLSLTPYISMYYLKSFWTKENEYSFRVHFVRWKGSNNAYT